MNALLLPPVARSRFPAANAATTVNRSLADELDFAGARIHLETDCGVVPAWYLGAKPRRDAIVMPLGRGGWRRALPRASALRRAHQLLQCGVSVMVVDVRGCEGWWNRLVGRSVARVTRAAMEYVVARGHDQEDCVVRLENRVASPTRSSVI